MNPQIATVVFVFGILCLFVLDRDRKARTSVALWIPVVWLLIAGSRAASAWLAVAGLANVPAWVDSPDVYLEGSPIDRNVFIFLLSLGLIVLALRGRKVGRVLRANGPILLFFTYCALSILWSDYPGVAFKRWIKAFGDLVMVLVVLTEPDRSAALKRFLARVGFLLVPVSILFIKYYPDLGRGYENLIWTPVFTGVTTGKNLLGATCMIWGIGAAWCFSQALERPGYKRRVGPLVAQGALLAMVLWLFWITNSMTSLACFLLATSLIIATSLRSIAARPWIVNLLVAIIIFIPFSVVYFGASAAALQTMGRDPTLTGRTDVWHEVISMAPNSWFGAGFESFWLGPRLAKIWERHWWHPNEAHNGYIEVFLNLGWTGVILLAIVVVTGYRNVVAALRQDPEQKGLRLAYFVAGVIFNFTESAFKALSPIWIFFLLVVTAVPKDPKSPGGRPLPIHYADNLAEREPASQVVGIGLHQEII